MVNSEEDQADEDIVSAILFVKGIQIKMSKQTEFLCEAMPLLAAYFRRAEGAGFDWVIVRWTERPPATVTADEMEPISTIHTAAGSIPNLFRSRTPALRASRAAANDKPGRNERGHYGVWTWREGSQQVYQTTVPLFLVQDRQTFVSITDKELELPRTDVIVQPIGSVTKISPTEVEQVNGQLAAFYSKIKPDIEVQVPIVSGMSHPFLISVSEEYLSARLRLMVIGMETRTWFEERESEPAPYILQPYGGNVQVRELMALHDWFMHPRNRRQYKERGFWPFVYKLQNQLNETYDERAILWSNLIKVDVNGSKPPAWIAGAIGNFNLVAREIEICRPNIVVFFTGCTSYYEDRLHRSLPQLKWRAVTTFPMDLLATSEDADTGVLYFRTHHPVNRRDWHGRRPEVLATIARIARTKN